MAKIKFRVLITTLMAELMLVHGGVGTALAADWPQDNHDPQHSGYTGDEPGDAAKWNFAWTWNGADGHNYNAPKEARTVSDGTLVYAPAGARGVYALNLTTGKQVWNFNAATVNAAPAVVNGYVWIPGSNGNLYKVNAATGGVAGSYQAESGINKAVLGVGNYLYILTDQGIIHKIDGGSLQRVWTYASGEPIGTSLAYSSSRDVIIMATNSLNVIAVNNTNGQLKWKTKPTIHTPGFPYEFDLGWPVVAEVPGVVFVRMRLSQNHLYTGLTANQGRYPATNSEIRDFLLNNPDHQNLFALNLDDGSKKFIPAVGYGSVEDFVNGSPYGDIGSMPVVRTLNDGRQVAYIHFRSAQVKVSNWDYRWDTHVGEMVLDNSLSGYVPGDMRYTGMDKAEGYTFAYITDEQSPLTMGGETLFHAHWGGTESYRITDRSAAKGTSLSNSFSGVNNPPMAVGAQTSGNSSHWSSTWFNLCGDGRAYSLGWYNYSNCGNSYPAPGSPVTSAYSAGILPRYTYVVNGYIVMEGNGGDLMALKHQGSVLPTVITTLVPTQPPINTPKPPKAGDGDNNGVVNGADFNIWLMNYGRTEVNGGAAEGDYFADRIINGKDYNVWLLAYGS